MAVLSNPANQFHARYLREADAAAQALGVKLQHLETRGPDDIDHVFQAAIKGQAGALLVVEDLIVLGYLARIVALAAKSRLPVVYGWREAVDAGGLMSYGPSFHDLYRRAPIYVDKILKGAKPAELPVEQPTKFELTINLKTAKALGLTIPPALLLQADRVVE